MVSVDIASRVEQRIEITGGEFSDTDQNPVGRAEPQIGSADRFVRALKRDPPGITDAGVDAQSFEFPFDDGFQSKRTGDNQIKRR